MNREDQAWRDLQRDAAAQLRSDFADRVLDVTKAPEAAAWRQLQAVAAAQLRPGFAERVLRAARTLPGVPSVGGQFVWGAATVALCLLGVLFFHTRSTQVQEAQNLAQWQQLAAASQDFDSAQ